MGIINKYPYTDFHEMNLDWFLDEFKKLYDSWVQFKADTEQEIDDFETAVRNDFADLVAQFDDFKDYVNNYLNTLDFPGAVADVITEMVNDGSFLNLIRPSISSEVTTWLNDHVEPTSPVVDNTLTIEGAAADSKTVGDIFADTMTLRESITAATDIDNLAVGFYYKDSGVTVTSGVNDRHARFIVFRGTGSGYAIAQIWIDTDNNNIYFRIKNTPSTAWTPWEGVLSDRKLIYHIEAMTEPGGIEGTSSFTASSGYLSNGGTNINYSRTEMMYEIDNQQGINDDWVRISIGMPEDQRILLDQIVVYFYNAAGDLIIRRSYTNNDFTNPRLVTITGNSEVKYFKVLLHSASNVPHYETLSILCNKPLIERYNLNKNNLAVGGDSLSFVYMIDDSTRRTSGRLILPSNYTVDGAKVPLIVYAHGSGSIPTWGSHMANNDRKLELFKYLANEGFAVFDCYPWTNEYLFDDNGNNAVYSPYKFPVIIQSYLKGIEYVCSRFNVDINKVSMIAKSQGGHLGHWAAVQNNFNFKCICLQAPDTMTGRANAFYNKNARSGFIYWMDVDGTETEKANFIEIGDVRNATLAPFMAKNKALFVGLQPFANGITNSSEDQLYNDFIGADSLNIPAWMQSEGLPATVPYSGASVPAFAAHDEYIKNSYVPVKFWCAFDDTSVSAYGNYAIYKWLRNGGNYVKWREVPAGTGGHTSMDTASNAEKLSGTTKLGIAYTDITTAWVEAVEFIRDCIGD